MAVFGHSAARFPTSCVEAFLLLNGAELADRSVLETIRNAASSVFESPAPLRDGAVEVLEQLSRRGLRLALLTKGAEEVQRQRIRDSGLAHFFDVVTILDHKTPASFMSAARQLGLDTGELISVGNSVESDVKPSQQAGIYAIWLPAYVWDYELRHDPTVEADLHQVGSLTDVIDIIGD